jgi:hypothetical protein
MQMDRREVVSAGAAAAAIAPFLASSPASAERPLGTTIVPKTKTFLSSNFYAPEVTIFDHRGCNRAPKEYKGGKTGDQDDEMLVRVKSVKVCDFPPNPLHSQNLRATSTTEQIYPLFPPPLIASNGGNAVV